MADGVGFFSPAEYTTFCFVDLCYFLFVSPNGGFLHFSYHKHIWGGDTYFVEGAFLCGQFIEIGERMEEGEREGGGGKIDSISNFIVVAFAVLLRVLVPTLPFY